MKPTVKRIPILLAGLALVLGLCGCSLETSVENLFTLPKVPVEYMGLSNMFDKPTIFHILLTFL